MPNRSPEPDSPLSRALREAQEQAREQMSAAWQLQMERLAGDLAGGWRNTVEHIFEERFRELRSAVELEVAKAVEMRVAQEVASRRRDLSEDLNLAIRQLRYFESEAQWCAALLNSAVGFCSRAALFAVSGGVLRYLGARGGHASGSEELVTAEIPLTSARAFANAVESCDTVVSVCAAGELGAPIAGHFGESLRKRVYLFPLFTRERVVAILYAEAEDSPADVSGLELLSALAAAAIETHLATQNARRPSNVVSIAPPPGPPATPKAAVAALSPGSGWAALSKQEQELHLEAQRQARVRVAEMRLYKSAAVKQGRVDRNLYASLREEIDTGRADFRARFLDLTPTMVDYLHLELTRTLANDDETLLGPEYPGPMV